MADISKWPITKFHFSVEIGEVEIPFQEVSGLDQETDVIEYRHGNSPDFHNIKRPGLMKYTDVTCKKGMFKGDARAFKVFQDAIINRDAYVKDEKRLTIVIKLLDNSKDSPTPLVTWTLKNAFPKKLSGTDLKSDASEIAIETLEFAHEELTVKIT